jgi:predicted DNA-binding WGR domain protein
MASTITVEGYQFDIGKRLRLVTATNKFWEAEIDGKKLHIRVGKDKDGTETNIEEMTKTYSTPELAKASVIEKIKEKLVKGYFLKGGMKEEPKDDKDLKRDPTDSKSVKS